MNRQFLQPFQAIKTFLRSKTRRYEGGIRYPGGIIYYPRDENHKDPEYTPTKLFRVERIKKLKGNPYWEKDILKQLKIDEDNRVAIVKNIPEMNSKLWKIKHLIKVTPIHFPYGEPTIEDIGHTILKENGQCLLTKTLKPADSQIEALEKFDTDTKKMDSSTIKRDSRLKWNNAFGGGF